MGIQGLLPFLKEATQPVNMRKYSGHTVAVDTYCWLHKGAFACSLQLAKGEKTDMYVRYCLKFVNMLRSMDVRPILVFDGCTLPAKKHVEKSRRERRELYNSKGRQFLREGKMSEARDCFNKCISVTPHMALDVMKAARSLGVDCIVAPYEADAQLTYMMKTGIVQAVITEDSDLVAFGCKRVIVKMDMNGNGLEIDSSKIHLAMKIGARFTPDKFRYMCIVAGCDYLPSLPGIGLAKARKLFQIATNTNLSEVIKRMPGTLKLKQTIPDEYVDGFHRANNTFLYQLAYDPRRRKLVPVNPYPDDIDRKNMEYAGKYLDDQQAYNVALGNLDINNMQRIYNFSPDRTKSYDRALPRHKLSIWHKDYRIGPDIAVVDLTEVDRQKTKGKQVTVKIMPRKRPREEDLPEVTPTDNDLASMYSNNTPMAKRKTPQQPDAIPETPPPSVKTKTPQQLMADKLLERAKSPTKSGMRRRNMFAVRGRNGGDNRGEIMKDRISSRFFTPPPSEEIDDQEPESNPMEESNMLFQDGVCKLETSESEQADSENEDTCRKSEWAFGEAVAAPSSSAKLATLDNLRQFQRCNSAPVLKSNVKVEGQSSIKEDGSGMDVDIVDQVKKEEDCGPETKDINFLRSSSQKSCRATPKGRSAFSWASSSQKSTRKSRHEKPTSGQGLARFMRTSSSSGMEKMVWNRGSGNYEEENKENAAVEEVDDGECNVEDRNTNSQISVISDDRLSQVSQESHLGSSQESHSHLGSSLKISQASDLYSMDADALSMSQFGVSRNSQVLNSQDPSDDNQEEDQLRGSGNSKLENLSNQDLDKDQLTSGVINDTSRKINQDAPSSSVMCQRQHLPKLPSIQSIEEDIPRHTDDQPDQNSLRIFAKTKTLTSFYASKPGKSLGVSSKQNSQDQRKDHESEDGAGQDRDQVAPSEMSQGESVSIPHQDMEKGIAATSGCSNSTSSNNSSQNIFTPVTNTSTSKLYTTKSAKSLNVSSSSRRNVRRKKDVTALKSSYFVLGSSNGVAKDDDVVNDPEKEDAADSSSTDAHDSTNSSSETTDVECIDLTKPYGSRKKEPKQIKLLQHSTHKKSPSAASTIKLKGACKASGLSKRRTSQLNQKKKTVDENDPRQTSLFSFMKKSAQSKKECEKKLHHPSDGPMSPTKMNIITDDDETPEGTLLAKKDVVRNAKRVIFS